MSYILVAREARSHHIQELINQFSDYTIIILKLNVIGLNKNPVKMKFICMLYNNYLTKEFDNKIIEIGKRESLDGDYIYFIVNEEGNIVKERTIYLEDNNYFGRLVDIDVYNQMSISRSDMSCEMRKCIICDSYAHLCARSKVHAQEEINNAIYELIETHLADFILSEVMSFIFEELEMFPKFGLVTHQNSGIHQDMDYETFVSSTFSMKPFIREFILFGIKNESDPQKLQKIGKKAEEAMFKVTNNINTQKGLIFALGIFLPAFTKAIANNLSEIDVKEEIIRLSKTIIGDYYSLIAKKEKLSHGDAIYVEHGIKGIRGEALKGFPLIFDIDQHNEINTSAQPYEYLLEIMSKLDDTTIIHKKGIDVLNEVKDTCSLIVENGGYTNNKKEVLQLSKEYIERGISPGGSSDILVLKIIFEKLKYLLGKRDA